MIEEDFLIIDEPEQPIILTPEQIKTSRYNRMTSIFVDKMRGVKELEIDKPFMNGLNAISLQKQSYDDMYEYAKQGLYDDDRNSLIIAKHEEAMKLVADLNLLDNEVRGVLTQAIEDDADNVEELLKEASNIKLTRDELTDKRLQEIREIFGI